MTFFTPKKHPFIRNYTLRRPGNTRHLETLTFKPQPLELTHFYQDSWRKPPRSNSIWTTSEYSPLDYTLFFISSTRHKKRKPMLVHANVTKKSTLYRIVLPPQATFSQRLVNKEHSSSPTTGQTYQLTLHNIDTSPSYSDQSTIAHRIRPTSLASHTLPAASKHRF